MITTAYKINGDPTEEAWKMTWKNIKYGTHTARELVSAIDEFKVSKFAADTLKRIVVSAHNEKEIQLVKASNGQLGFAEKANRIDVYNRIVKLGFVLIPAELGPQLRRQYKDQPLGECLLMAMLPVVDSSGIMRIFGVEHNSLGEWLYAHRGDPDTYWRTEDENHWQWVFAKKN